MRNNRQTNRVFKEEWYNCDRCGHQYPRSQVIVQNQYIVCTGHGTLNCIDQPGVDAFRRDLPQEQPVEPLPQIIEDL
jgi:hypothetical protein